MTGRRHLSLLILAAIVASFLLSLHFFVTPLRPWPDQGWVLQAAQRHAAGLGLTTQMNSSSLDITAPEFAHLTYFPPLYPLMVSMLLRIGLGVEGAVKLINALAMIVGIAGWIALASRTLRDRNWLWLFALLLVVTGSATIPKGGTADYLYWAIIPWWCLVLLVAAGKLGSSPRDVECTHEVPRVPAPPPARDDGATVRSRSDSGGESSSPFHPDGGGEGGNATRKEQEGDERRWFVSKEIVLASLLVCIAIGIRWAAVVLVPAGILVLVLLAPGIRCLRTALRALASAVLYAVPPTATYFGITAINRTLGGSESVLSFVPVGWRFHHLLTSDPLQYLVTIPLAIQPLADRVQRLLGPAEAAGGMTALFQFVFPLAGLVIFATLVARRRERLREATDAREVAIAASSTLAVWVGFLAFMAVRYNWDHVDWSYLQEPRYFRPIVPLAGLLWLAILDVVVKEKVLRRAIAAILIVGSLYLVQAGARWQVTWLTEPDESWEAVKEVLELQSQPGAHVVIDQDVSDYFIRGRRDLAAHWYFEPEKVDRLEVGRPARLWVVWRVEERSAYVTDPEYDQKRFAAIRRRFGIERVWTSSGGAFEIWGARIDVNPQWSRDAPVSSESLRDRCNVRAATVTLWRTSRAKRKRPDDEPCSPWNYRHSNCGF